MLRYVLICLAYLLASQSFANKIAHTQGLIRDAEIEGILQEFSDPIFSAAGLEPEDVSIFIINDPGLNAFVANGQHMHLNTGLITTVTNANQLKGVIAHETGHIAGGHLARSGQAIKAATRTSLVTIGLGVLAIAAGAGDAGAALIAGSQQIATLTYFKHTRVQESAADQAALSYLISTRESPQGLIEFFNNFRYQEVLSDARRYAYFRTHPLSADRIQALRQRAKKSGQPEYIPDADAEYKLSMMQAKLIGFLSTPAHVYQRYPIEDVSQQARYARAVAGFRAADLAAALKEIDSLLEDEPENPYYWELKGQILFESGLSAESVKPHAHAVRLGDNHPLLQINLARSLIVRSNEGDFERAENLLRQALHSERENAFAWYQMSIVLEKQGRRAEAELAIAEQSYYLGNYTRADIFADRALKGLDTNSPLARRAADIRLITHPLLQSRRPVRLAADYHTHNVLHTHD